MLLIGLHAEPLVLVVLELLHAEAHDVLHLRDHFQVDILKALLTVNLIQSALLTHVLAILKIVKLRWPAAAA